jgi:hypothetical protein
VLAPVVGATFGALDVIETMFGSNRKPFFTAYARMSDSPGARHWLAEATTLARRAERTMLDLAATVDEDSEITDLDSSRMQQDRAAAAADCRAAIERMLDLHGASGFRTTNALQHFWRGGKPSPTAQPLPGGRGLRPCADRRQLRRDTQGTIGDAPRAYRKSEGGARPADGQRGGVVRSAVLIRK